MATHSSIFIWEIPPDTKNWLIGKDPDAGKYWRQRRWRWWRMGRFDSIADSMDMSLSRLGRQWRTERLECYSPWVKKAGHTLATEKHPPLSYGFQFPNEWFECLSAPNIWSHSTWVSLAPKHLPQEGYLGCCCCLVTKSCLTLLWPHGLEPTRFLCPWDFPGTDTVLGCHFLLQGTFQT